MSPLKLLGLYAITLVVFLGIGFVWLSTMGDSFYRKQLGSMMRETSRGTTLTAVVSTAGYFVARWPG